jgi:hypothetical protein
MIECIFTIDYEIYGNGEGSLKELVYEPAKRLLAAFRERNARFMPFVEVVELEMIETAGTDHAIDLVKDQIREFHRDGFELGLHLHPQWYNARYEDGKWLLDYSEYNLCTLPRERIVQIVESTITYLRKVLGEPDFTPLSFRAGNWLFQPTLTAASVLAERGVKVDTSVFKGGLQHQHKLDYRRALKNGYYWPFTEHVDVPDPNGALVEIPIYTQMVPFWKMFTSKRLSMQQRNTSSAKKKKNRLNRLPDFLRFFQPKKFDFCRMTIDELTSMFDMIIHEDKEDPATLRPIVAIGHTKDLVDLDTVDSFLSYLQQNKITISTFKDIYLRCVAVPERLEERAL